MRLRFFFIALFFLTYLVYFSSFFNPFIWDDEQFIYKNVHVIEFNLREIFTKNTIDGAGIMSNYYRPLTTLSFALDTAVWKSNTLGFHLTNTFFHTATAILIMFSVYLLTKRKWTSFWIALIFALHPLQTEAVTYINSRGDSLSAFFGLLSSICTVLYSKKKTIAFSLYNIQHTFSARWFFMGSLLLYAASILSKEIGIATIALSASFIIKEIIDWMRTHKKTAIKNILTTFSSQFILLIVLSLIALGYLLLRATTLNFNNSFNFYAESSQYSESLSVRLATFSKVLWTYWQLLIIPYPLHMERDSEIITSVISFWPILTGIVLLTLVATTLYQLIKKQNSIYLVSCIWFFSLLLPVSGIIPINGILYEHWLYLPSVGFFLFFAELLHAIAQKITWKNSRKYIQVFMILLCCSYAILTIRQNYIWGDEIRFYEYTLQHAQSLRLYNNLGMTYADRKKYDQALKAYSQALTFGISHPSLYHNMANTFVGQQKLKEAQQYYEKALTSEPKFFHSYVPLLSLYLLNKDATAAGKLREQAHHNFSDPQFLKSIDSLVDTTVQ